MSASRRGVREAVAAWRALPWLGRARMVAALHNEIEDAEAGSESAEDVAVARAGVALLVAASEDEPTQTAHAGDCLYVTTMGGSCNCGVR